MVILKGRISREQKKSRITNETSKLLNNTDSNSNKNSFLIPSPILNTSTPHTSISIFEL